MKKLACIVVGLCAVPAAAQSSLGQQHEAREFRSVTIDGGRSNASAAGLGELGPFAKVGGMQQWGKIILVPSDRRYQETGGFASLQQMSVQSSFGATSLGAQAEIGGYVALGELPPGPYVGVVKEVGSPELAPRDGSDRSQASASSFGLVSQIGSPELAPRDGNRSGVSALGTVKEIGSPELTARDGREGSSRAIGGLVKEIGSPGLVARDGRDQGIHRGDSAASSRSSEEVGQVAQFPDPLVWGVRDHRSSALVKEIGKPTIPPRRGGLSFEGRGRMKQIQLPPLAAGGSGSGEIEPHPILRDGEALASQAVGTQEVTVYGRSGSYYALMLLPFGSTNGPRILLAEGMLFGEDPSETPRKLVLRVPSEFGVMLVPYEG